MSIVVEIYLYPLEGGLINPIRSMHIIENGVSLNGSFRLGALGTVSFDTFLCQRSHGVELHTHVCKTPAVLCSMF